MADKDLTGKDLAKNLSSSKRDAADVAKSAKAIENSLSAAAKAISGAFGKGKFIQAMGGAHNGKDYMAGGSNGGMPNQSDMQNNSLMRPGVGLTDFTNFAAGMNKGFSSLLPDVASTIQRAGTYYNATIMGGYRGSERISRGEVENRTYGVLSSMGGITSAGSSANVANIFANQGMVASSDTYMQNTRAVGNAARYLNMSNEKAATAIGGLGTGASSANIMRNFGIYTTDPTTGKERSMTQIFEELAGRFTKPGANATAEDVQNSIRKGALGANIAASGLSADQQTLFKQYLIDRAGGNTMDLSNQEGMNKLMGKNSSLAPGSIVDSMNKNPLNSFMDLETSEEGAQKSSTGAYIDGIEAATIQLKGLDLIAGQLGKSLGAVTSMLQTTLGAKTIQGLLGMAGSSINLISSGMEAMMSADPTGLSRLAAGGAAVAAGGVGLSATINTGTAAFWAGLFGGSGATEHGAGTGAGDGENSMNGEGVADLLKATKSADVNTRTAAAGGTSVGLPAGAAKVLTEFNAPAYDDKGNMIKANHDGIDYTAREGTPVYAVADGTVKEVKTDGKRHKAGTDYGGKWPYGNVVKIQHETNAQGKEQVTVYAHLKDVYVKYNQVVKKGDKIGTIGMTGRAYSPHLHFEYKVDGVETDPKKFKTFGAGAKGASQYSATDMAFGQTLVNAVSSFFSGDTQSAISQLTAALGVDALSSKYGVSTSSPANPYANAGNTGSSGGGGGSGGSVTNNVGGITVNIKDATPESAKKFAEYVQEYLNSQSLTSNLGSL